MRHLRTIAAAATPLLALTPIALAAASLVGWTSVIGAWSIIAALQGVAWACHASMVPGTPAAAAAQPPGTIPFAERDTNMRSAGVMSVFLTPLVVASMTTMLTMVLLALSVLVADAGALLPGATTALAFIAMLLIPVRPADTSTLRESIKPVGSLLAWVALAAVCWWAFEQAGGASSPRWFAQAMSLLVVVGPLAGVAKGAWQLWSGRDRRGQEQDRRLLLIVYVGNAAVTVLALLFVVAMDARLQESLGLL